MPPRKSGGRSLRQPGQVLTEAATTNSLRVVPASTFFLKSNSISFASLMVGMVLSCPICQNGRLHIISDLDGSAMLNPVMNNTKWDELRIAMDAIMPPLSWSTLSKNGYVYGPDSDWFCHFRMGGYEDIVHVDIHLRTADQRELVRSALRKVHVPGEDTPEGFRVFGYLQDGQGADYI